MNKTLLNVKAPETLYGLRELLSIKKAHRAFDKYFFSASNVSG